MKVEASTWFLRAVLQHPKKYYQPLDLADYNFFGYAVTYYDIGTKGKIFFGYFYALQVIVDAIAIFVDRDIVNSGGIFVDYGSV